MAAARIYGQVSQERYEIITRNYEQWRKALNDADVEAVTVFNPLGKKLLQELELIREVSKELQQKKEDDIKKAAQAAEQQAEEAKAEAEKKAEEAAAAVEAEDKPEEQQKSE